MGSDSGYRGLEVYQVAHRLGVDIHHFSLTLPKYELYESASQVRRSSKSVSANLVEGYGRRRYKADYTRFLCFSLASCDETAEWLRYIHDCHPDHADTASNFLNTIDQLGKRLNNFMRSVVEGRGK